MAYELKLPQELEEIHLGFHISMLKKCLGDTSLIVPTENVGIKKNFSYDEVPAQIFDRQIRNLRTKEVASVKSFEGTNFLKKRLERQRRI